MRVNLNIDGAPITSRSDTHPSHSQGSSLLTSSLSLGVPVPRTKVGSSLAKVASKRVNLNIDGAPITSRSHTHPSHSQVSRLLTSSLSLGVPVPLTMECIRGV